MSRGLQRSGFDKLARPYRWMEYLTFGPLLQRTRLHYLPALGDARRVLVLGDGDGRFAVELLSQVSEATVVAVDASAAMLRELSARARSRGVEPRLRTVHADAIGELPTGDFDLVCTHFFLDCLSEDAVADLAARIHRLHPRARWVISEFAVPAGRGRLPAWLIVRMLYAAFRVLTGLRTQHLPNHRSVLQNHGFVLQANHTRAFGLLRAELWQASQADEEVHPIREGVILPESTERSSAVMNNASDGAEPPERWPATYPPMGEDAETPWLPSDPIPNPEPEAPGMNMPDPGIYEARTASSLPLQ